MTHVEHVQRLLEMGHLNQPFSSEVDMEMATRAFESAIRLDRRDGQPAQTTADSRGEA